MKGLLQEAFDIFGDVGDLLEIYDQRKREEADGAEEEQEPDFSDEEAAETFRTEQVLNKQGRSCFNVCLARQKENAELQSAASARQTMCCI